jgi:RNA polymerase sigma factor (sigma-70 family)
MESTGGLTEAQLEQLYQPVTKFILSTYYESDWEDVVQKTMLQLWRKRHLFRLSANTKLSSWGVSFARLTLLTHLKAEKKHKDALSFEACLDKGVDFYFGEDPETLLRSILDDECNAIVTASLANYKIPEIAEMLGISYRTVVRRRMYIRDRLLELYPNLK